MVAKAEVQVVVNAKDNASKVLGGMGGKLGGIFQKIGSAMPIIGGAIAGISAAIGASLKKFADFEKGMAEVNTMMGLSDEQLTAYSDSVRDLAKAMGVDVTDMVGALYQAISAGVPSENALQFLEVASKAAIGGVTDTETAVDGLTTVINAFGMSVDDAQHVADIMFMTVKGGKTTFEELSASMYNVAPIAASMGIGFDEVAAGLATLTQQGVPTAQATTQLRGAIAAMVKPTTQMSDMIASLGYESAKTMIAEEGLFGAFNKIYDAANGDEVALGEMFGRIEGLNAVLSLTGPNVDKTTASLENMRAASEGAGASTEAFNEINDTAARQWEILQGKMNDVFLVVGKSLMPVLIPMLDLFTQLMDIMPVEEFMEFISKALEPLIAVIKEIFVAMEPVWQIMFTFMRAVLKPMGSVISWLVEHALKPFLNILQKVSDAMEWASGILGNVFPQWFGGGTTPAAASGSVSNLGVATGSLAGNVTNINVAGSVITESDLTGLVHDQLLEVQNNNYNLGFVP